MDYRRLGRTGLEVSVLSLGTGGPNRLGQSRRVPRDHINRLINQALELGVNLFDTSAAYELSESILGEALRGVPRDRYIMASKIFPWIQGRLFTPLEIRQQVERSLRRLRVDELEILQLHRVVPEHYPSMRDQVFPELQKLRDEGKLRYLGISGSSTRDPEHRVLQAALQDNLYDTVMVLYHPTNTLAELEILPKAQQQDVGVICMASARHFVPRKAADRLRLLARTLLGFVTSPPKDMSRINSRLSAAWRDLHRVSPSIPLIAQGLGSTRALQLPEAVFTFALTRPEVTSVLTGTTNLELLRHNIAAALAPALTAAEREHLQACLK